MNKPQNFGDLLRENRTENGAARRADYAVRREAEIDAAQLRSVVLFLLDTLDKIAYDILAGQPQPKTTIPQHLMTIGFVPKLAEVMQPQLIPLWDWFCSVLAGQGLVIEWDYPELDTFWVIPRKTGTVLSLKDHPRG